jgi:protein arginine kinase activator
MMPVAPTSSIVCPVCGFREENFARQLRLGCPTCYLTFAPHLETLLPRIQRGLRHAGRVPHVQPPWASVSAR